MPRSSWFESLAALEVRREAAKAAGDEEAVKRYNRQIRHIRGRIRSLR